MTIDRIRIDGKTYVLAPGQDVAALKLAIETAASAGASFVDFLAAGGHAISALISPGVSVRIESTESVDEAPSDGALATPFDPSDVSDFYDV
ncbi:MAG: hypothetical protein JWM50_287 [Microbacteriaceae bacterium]|jgi:hypothetical protein|nr:hypothetical protein [Microbacteriaceae bacterium]